MYIRKGYRENGYIFDREIGSGVYGTVWSATNDRGEKVAIKIFQDNVHSEDITTEIAALDDLTRKELCEWSICLENVYQQEKLIRVVTNLVEGDTMANYTFETPLSRRTNDMKPLKLIIGLDYIHKKDISHKDLKLENIQRRASDGNFIILDWGVACLKKRCKGENCKNEFNCLGSGTEYTMPPQLKFGYENYTQWKFQDSLAHDIWSLGVILLDYYTTEKGVDKYANSKSTYQLTNSEIKKEISQINNPIITNILSLMLKRNKRERLDGWSQVVEIVKKYIDCLNNEDYPI